MTGTFSVLFVCLALIGAPLAAQDKPAFAGTWKLADPATADTFTPTVMTVVQDAGALTVTTTSQMGEFKTSYKLDGSEAPSPMEFNGNDDRPYGEAGLGRQQAAADHDVKDGRAVVRVQVGVDADGRRDAGDRNDRPRLPGRRGTDHHEGDLQEEMI